MPVVEAIRAGAQAIVPTAAPLGGALVEETALIARWLAAPACASCAATAPTTRRLGLAAAVAGPWAAWAAAARSARAAAEQAVNDWQSNGLTEPHPPREKLFGRAAVDRRGGAGQPVLPRRQPFGAAG
ncbi:DNA polymerase III epsilon subunit domain protein [Mycobacterium xenopi 4042]|uniref:DNA polymerase III epsilon subunit domain protein n=1 Tax=Mycobacterium xenopi 4042 TaxID=1299334 RepID=X7ZZ59_MYCXE|nr:DNA polymerase III epsilon subunit domain protein [Mycobacterium xenopi 4042]